MSAGSGASVYRLYDSNGTLLYVGCSQNVDRRLLQHHKKPWWPSVSEVAVERFPTKYRALDEEAEAIVIERPLYNVAGRKASRLKKPVAHRLVMQEFGHLLTGMVRKPGLSFLATVEELAEKCQERLGEPVCRQDLQLVMHGRITLSLREFAVIADLLALSHEQIGTLLELLADETGLKRINAENVRLAEVVSGLTPTVTPSNKT